MAIESEHGDVALMAIADQVQTIIQNSPYPVVMFVLVSADAAVEVRTVIPTVTTKAVLTELAEAYTANPEQDAQFEDDE